MKFSHCLNLIRSGFKSFGNSGGNFYIQFLVTIIITASFTKETAYFFCVCVWELSPPIGENAVRIWSHLLKKSLTENFIFLCNEFCAISLVVMGNCVRTSEELPKIYQNTSFLLPVFSRIRTEYTIQI